MKTEFFYIHSINKSITTKGMNMNTTIQKLDELLAQVRASLIKKKGLQENKQNPDNEYLIKVFNYLKNTGYITSQYEFSERFLNKNKYYFGMILSEQRQPSIDALHFLIKSISELNDTPDNPFKIDNLYDEGKDLITKRLLKYF